MTVSLAKITGSITRTQSLAVGFSETNTLIKVTKLFFLCLRRQKCLYYWYRIVSKDMKMGMNVKVNRHYVMQIACLLHIESEHKLCLIDSVSAFVVSRDENSNIQVPHFTQTVTGQVV